MAGSRVGLTRCEPEGRNGYGWLTCHLPLTNFMTAYNSKRSGLSYVAAGAADGDAEAAGRRTTCGGPNDGGAATAATAAGGESHKVSILALTQSYAPDASDHDAEKEATNVHASLAELQRTCKHLHRRPMVPRGKGAAPFRQICLCRPIRLDFKIGLERQRRSS